MLSTDMATKTRKPPGKAPRSTRGDTEGRKLSRLTRIGDEAKAVAQRKALLDALKANDWNLTATAEALEMGALASVIRALKELAPEEYEAAKMDGRISPGNRRE